jgi:hypothetical protein
MSVVPSKPIERVQFYENHIAPFTANAIAIGLTEPEVSDLEAKTEAARAAWDALQAARQTAETRTAAFHAAVALMSLAGAAAIKKIRGKAEQVGGNTVYELSDIPAPATPEPVTTLGKPNRFTAELDENGGLALVWKCSNPRATGVVYQIWRRHTPTGEFVYLGGVGQKKFLDTTIPAGSSEVTYKVHAARSTAVGPWAQFNVNFGMSTGGGMIAKITTSEPKMAA